MIIKKGIYGTFEHDDEHRTNILVEALCQFLFLFYCLQVSKLLKLLINHYIHN